MTRGAGQGAVAGKEGGGGKRVVVRREAKKKGGVKGDSNGESGVRKGACQDLRIGDGA